ncbi:PQQ-binding-like beta-propeller repeat protein [Actinophytocola xinjiangensis]|uniref:outer membrane protein assembly factor BamB family protein n=1 Tax=Actinophytocola xinjiangensis TaxID=485602 RepID=UPI000A014A19|nr:PQQ-binding-like beta-propeller repeat protein [Actinophytocola xinjiangensis]
MARARGVLVLVSLAVLASACSGGEEEQVRVEHRTGTAPAALPGAGGPPPGILTERWQAGEIPTHSATTRPEADFALDSGNLVVFNDSGVRSYAVASGEPGWSYHEPGRRVSGFVSDGVVVLSSTDSETANTEGAVNRLVGLAAGDGKLLWEKKNEWRTDEFPPADGVIAALPADRHEAGPLTGIDVRTGEVRWETEFRRCGIPNLTRPSWHDGSLVLVSGVCAPGRQWDAFDPADGRHLWTQELDASIPGGSTSGVSIEDETVFSHRGEEVVRIDRDGTAHDPVPARPGNQFGAYQVIKAAPRLSLRDLRTAEEAVTGWPSLLGPAAFDGDTMYYLNQAGVADWLPQLVVGDLATGTQQSMPLPGAVPFPAQPVWLGVTGEHLLFAHRADDHTVSVIALTSTPTDGPVDLGGVPHESWPAPCDLLDAVTLPGGAGQEEPTLTDTTGTVEVPQVDCVRRLPDGDRLTLRVAWVAATEEQAAGRLGGTPGPTGVDEIGQSPTGMAGARIARIGTVFVEVWTEDQDTITTTLEQVAAHLRS